MDLFKRNRFYFSGSVLIIPIAFVTALSFDEPHCYFAAVVAALMLSYVLMYLDERYSRKEVC